MRHFAGCALVISLALAPAVPAATAPAATPAVVPAPSAARGSVLLVDFVELGRADGNVPRDIAMVDLLNLSELVLDVIVGQGSATLQPKERIIARVAAGDQTVTVSSRDGVVARMEGKIHLDSGLRYELALGYGPAPDAAGSMAAPGIDAEAGPEIAPKPGDAAAPAQPRKEPSRTKSGKVDIGRKPRR